MRNVSHLLRSAAVRSLFALAGVGNAAMASTATEVAWAQAEHPSATPGAVLAFEVVKGREFGAAEGGFPSTQLERAELRLPAPLGLATFNAQNGAINGWATLPRPGVAVLEFHFKPEARSISRSDAERYLRRLHADDEVRQHWSAIAAPNPWQEVRRVTLRTYVRVGTPPPVDVSWSQPAAKGLELVPDSDPTAISTGARFDVRLLRDGRPISGGMVEFLSWGEARQYVVTTDENGRAGAVLDAPGKWLVQAWRVDRVQGGNHDWDVDHVAVTVEVR